MSFGIDQGTIRVDALAVVLEIEQAGGTTRKLGEGSGAAWIALG